MKDLNTYIEQELAVSLKLKKDFVELNQQKTIELAELMAKISKNGSKVIYFGNGGSAADAQHLTAEHVNKLLVERPAMPALALTTDTSVITSIANDISFEAIFSRQLEALGNKNDIAIALSTSGNSANVIKALITARKKGLTTVAFTGGDGGRIVKEKLADFIFNVEGSKVSARIQESHIFLGHILIELMDKILMTK